MSESESHPFVTHAAMASIGAGVMHASAVSMHAEHPGLARIFVVLSLAQVGWGLLALRRSATLVLWAGLAVSVVAVGGWTATRVTGIGWIPGLEQSEAPGVADTLCAVLGFAAAAICAAGLVVGRVPSRAGMAAPAFAAAALVLPGMWVGASHVHDGGHGHTDVEWPRPFDPAEPVDLSGVAGVSSVQEQRALALIADTARDLPRWSSTEAAIADGYRSIGDSVTGFEHYIKGELVVDGKFLDSSAPESLVYRVDGPDRTLVSAMYMAPPSVPLEDPMLTDYAGPLMQWHAHDNLCWRLGQGGTPVVAGITDASGRCTVGSLRTGFGVAMVHVWITPHECGPFAAVEGIAAGTAAVDDSERVDLCDHAH
jgi:hypothetical protein